MNWQQEQILIVQAKAGDKQALSSLWDVITPKLYGYLVNSCRDKALAEDLLQTSWLKAIEGLSKFNPQGVGLSPWLFAIARNELRQHWRKSNREVAFDPSVHEQTNDNHHESENQILVEQMLALLSEDDRELIRLRYIADLSINDIARILNINFVSARVRLHRALKRARSVVIS